MTRHSFLLSLLAAAALTGCAAVGPDYQAPDAQSLKLPTAWYAAALDESAHGPRQQAWWQELADPALNALVEAALRASPTVEAATGRLAEARASQLQVLASGTPTIAATAGDVRAQQPTALMTASSAALNASWELDLFGAVRRGTEGAQARVEARQADLADVHVSLAADVADAYSVLRQCQAAVQLAQQDLVSRLATAQLMALKAEAGFVAPYLAARAQATAAEGQTALAGLGLQCERTTLLLVRLTGLERKALQSLLAGTRAIPAPVRLDVALPEEVLRMRPDLVQAERNLAAAAADVGLAQANRYPRLSLSGSWGYNSTQTSMGTVSVGVWSVGPTLSVPVFDGGARKAGAQAAQARYEQALAAYRLKARIAVQEVEDALTRYAASIQRQRTAQEAVDNYRRSFAAMDARFREGASSLLELEDARRALFAAQQTASTVQLEKAQAWIALHRATGGGWQPGAEQGNALANSLANSTSSR